MPFRRRMNPVKRDKHEITWSLLGIDNSTATRIGLAATVDVGAKTAAGQTSLGSHVYGIYLEFQFSAETITNTKIVHWQIVGELTGQTATAPNTYYSDDRAQIFKRGMEMLPKSVNTIVKRIVFVRIPKAWHRQKQGAELIFQFETSSAETINACGFAIYKELY